MMILPKHAFEALMKLITMEKEFMPYKQQTAQYFKLQPTYMIGKTLDIRTYTEMLLAVTASIDGEITSSEISAIQFITGTSASYKTSAKKAIDFIRNYPPALLFDAFTYQNATGNIVLPELLSHMETMVQFVGQLNTGNGADKLYSDMVDLFQRALENRIVSVPSSSSEPKKEDSESNVQEAPDDVDEALAQLNNLVGLSQIKSDVASMIDLIKLREIRKSHNLQNPDMSFHMVFSGNPGTGKTTVARILAKIYRDLGVLSNGQLVETDRSGLVGGYVGQTAIKVQDVVSEAIGGILFIDEAYSLCSNDSQNDFGDEAIETLLKLMEDNRDDLIVIVAGYTDLMEKFLDSNPGLRSRFNKKFVFPDYSADELMQIFLAMCEKNNYKLTDEARQKAARHFESETKNKGENFGNARDVRNYFEKAIATQASRIVKLSSPSKDEVELLKEADIHI